MQLKGSICRPVAGLIFVDTGFVLSVLGVHDPAGSEGHVIMTSFVCWIQLCLRLARLLPLSEYSSFQLGAFHVNVHLTSTSAFNRFTCIGACSPRLSGNFSGSSVLLGC